MQVAVDVHAHAAGGRLNAVLAEDGLYAHVVARGDQHG